MVIPILSNLFKSYHNIWLRAASWHITHTLLGWDVWHYYQISMYLTTPTDKADKHQLRNAWKSRIKTNIIRERLALACNKSRLMSPCIQSFQSEYKHVLWRHLATLTGHAAKNAPRARRHCTRVVVHKLLSFSALNVHQDFITPQMSMICDILSWFDVVAFNL